MRQLESLLTTQSTPVSRIELHFTSAIAVEICGYFTAKVLDQDVKIRKKDAGKFRIPLFYPNKASILADVTVPVEEGRQYHLNKITFEGVKLFKTPDLLMKPLFQMAESSVKILNEIVTGKSEELIRKILIPELIIRDSCAAPSH